MKQDFYDSTDTKFSVIDLNGLMATFEVEKISKDESDCIEGPINYEEAGTILKTMSNYRSPGSDGFT